MSHQPEAGIDTTTSIRKVLMATDFEDYARHLLDEAVLVARQMHASLTLLHVLTPPASLYSFYVEGVPWPEDQLTSQAQKTMDGTVAHARAAYAAVEGAVVAGVPWEAILDYAQRGRFDLVMVGTHGRRGMKRMLLGSVAEKVVRMSPVPVLTIPCHSTE